MSRIRDLTGQRFGRLTVLERAPDYVSCGCLRQEASNDRIAAVRAARKGRVKQ